MIKLGDTVQQLQGSILEVGAIAQVVFCDYCGTVRVRYDDGTYSGFLPATHFARSK